MRAIVERDLFPVQRVILPFFQYSSSSFFFTQNRAKKLRLFRKNVVLGEARGLAGGALVRTGREKVKKKKGKRTEKKTKKVQFFEEIEQMKKNEKKKKTNETMEKWKNGKNQKKKKKRKQRKNILNNLSN